MCHEEEKSCEGNGERNTKLHVAYLFLGYLSLGSFLQTTISSIKVPHYWANWPHDFHRPWNQQFDNLHLMNVEAIIDHREIGVSSELTDHFLFWESAVSRPLLRMQAKQGKFRATPAGFHRVHPRLGAKGILE